MNTYTMTLSLHAPGMTPVHRVGIAGLYMTLQRITVEHLDVELSDTRITLSWEEHHTRQVLLDLFGQGLTLDDDGIMAFPGFLDEHGDMPSPYQRLLFQEALCTTLLQHGKSRTWADQGAITMGDEEGPRYLPLKKFVHQNGGEVLYNELSKPRGPGSFRVAAWLYPGATEKHPGKAWSRMEVSLEEALGLYFLPVGLAAWSVQSQLTHRWKHGRGSVIRPYQGEMAVLVLPSITSLPMYAEWRRAMAQKPIEESKVSCLEDALCRVAASLNENVQHLPIHVMAYGVQDWSTQQKTRQYVRSFELSASKIAFIRTCLDRIPELHPVYSNHYWRTSPVWEGVCRALVVERPWFEGVALAYENSHENLFTSTQNAPFHRRAQHHALAKMVAL